MTCKILLRKLKLEQHQNGRGTRVPRKGKPGATSKTEEELVCPGRVKLEQHQKPKGNSCAPEG